MLCQVGGRLLATLGAPHFPATSTAAAALCEGRACAEGTAALAFSPTPVSSRTRAPSRAPAGPLANAAASRAARLAWDLPQPHPGRRLSAQAALLSPDVRKALITEQLIA
jgi:hypothetical protein